MSRLLGVAALIGAIAIATTGSATATSAGSTIPFHARIANKLGLIPPVELKQGASSGAITNSAPASGSLSYNGGPVMPTSNVYAIYWAPSGYTFPAGYTADMNGYFQNLQADDGKDTNTYVNGTQYYEQSGSTKQYVQYKTTFAGSTVDTDALPSLDPVNCPDTPVAAAGGVNGGQSTTAGCVTDGQVQQEISTVIKREGWPVNNQTEFFMFTAPNIGTCFPATVSEDTGEGVVVNVTAPLCSFSYFCAYHSSYYDSAVSPNSAVIYANMPYAAQTDGNPVTCDEGSYPNGNPSDPEISVTSHEHNESITDPFGNAWWDSNPNDSAYGDEDGDMCAWDFGNLYGADGAQYNQTINGHHYLMQLEWDDSTNGCPGSDSSGNGVKGEANYDTPEISLTPNTGYGTAPFEILGQFFQVGTTAASKFTDAAGKTTTLATAPTNPSGHFKLMTAVPSSAAAGTATVSSTGTAGTATAPFTVPTK